MKPFFDSKISLNLKPTFHILSMYENYPLCTITFPSANALNITINIDHFNPSENKDQLHNDVTCGSISVNRIHTEELDLLEFKKFNDLPAWNPVLRSLTPFKPRSLLHLTWSHFD